MEETMLLGSEGLRRRLHTGKQYTMR